MNKKPIEKRLIWIYPIKHSNTFPISPRTRVDNFEGPDGSKLFKENLSSADLLRPVPAIKGDKRNKYFGCRNKLPSLNKIKSLSPQFRKE